MPWLKHQARQFLTGSKVFPLWTIIYHKNKKVRSPICHQLYAYPRPFYEQTSCVVHLYESWMKNIEKQCIHWCYAVIVVSLSIAFIFLSHIYSPLSWFCKLSIYYHFSNVLVFFLFVFFFCLFVFCSLKCIKTPSCHQSYLVKHMLLPSRVGWTA